MKGLPEKCPSCGAPTYGNVVLNSEGYPVCMVCGYVFEQETLNIDHGAEYFSALKDREKRDKRRRTGAPLTNLTHDGGVSSMIKPRSRREGGLGNDERTRKLIKAQQKVRRGKDEKLINTLKRVNRYAAELELPTVVRESAARIVKKLYEAKLLKKNNLDEYIAAAIFAAARMEKHPLPAKDIVNKLGVDKQRFWTAYRNLVEKLRGHVKRQRPPSPAAYVQRIGSELGLSSQVVSLAEKIAAKIDSMGLSQGKPPQAVAGAAIYIASIIMSEKRNQTQVAGVIGVTDATIRNRYRDILDNLFIEVHL